MLVSQYSRNFLHCYNQVTMSAETAIADVAGWGKDLIESDLDGSAGMYAL